MIETAGVDMAKPGRPKKSDGDRGTTHTRVFSDLADMIAWINRVEGGSSAQLLDPMVRPQIVARYTKHLPLIEQLKAAEEAQERAEEEARRVAGAKKKGKKSG